MKMKISKDPTLSGFKIPTSYNYRGTIYINVGTIYINVGTIYINVYA